MMLKRTHIINCTMHDNPYKVLLWGICRYSLCVGNKTFTEFAFDHLPDVDSSDDRVVCNTISQFMGSSPILALNFFFSWPSLHNCITYSLPCNGFSSVIQITTLLKEVS